MKKISIITFSILLLAMSGCEAKKEKIEYHCNYTERIVTKDGRSWWDGYREHYLDETNNTCIVYETNSSDDRLRVLYKYPARPITEKFPVCDDNNHVLDENTDTCSYTGETIRGKQKIEERGGKVIYSCPDNYKYKYTLAKIKPYEESIFAGYEYKGTLYVGDLGYYCKTDEVKIYSDHYPGESLKSDGFIVKEEYELDHYRGYYWTNMILESVTCPEGYEQGDTETWSPIECIQKITYKAKIK